MRPTRLQQFSMGCALLFLLAGRSSEDTAINVAQTQTTMATATGASDSPQYEVDVSWPQQLPNDWILGQVSGIAVDSQDNIWIIQRPRTLTAHELGAVQNPPATECCYPAPSDLSLINI